MLIKKIQYAYQYKKINIFFKKLIILSGNYIEPAMYKNLTRFSPYLRDKINKNFD